MKYIRTLAVVGLLAMLLVVPTLAGAKGCKGCETISIAIPHYTVIHQERCLTLSDYPAKSVVCEYFLSSGYAEKCMCVDADSHAGPNDPPEKRACQYLHFHTPSITPRPYLESEYCKWDQGVVSESTCMSNGKECPWY
jgi:hypothetical protein